MTSITYVELVSGARQWLPNLHWFLNGNCLFGMQQKASDGYFAQQMVAGINTIKLILWYRITELMMGNKFYQDTQKPTKRSVSAQMKIVWMQNCYCCAILSRQ